KKSFFDKKRS
nr:Chain G, DNA polymerase kappa [Homo sapiens]